ncbi:MAG: recombinase family protein [Oscillospiraceae bacterium]|nr:recombinase family protein [Oscillospiraceae bacterium]
MTSDNKVNGNVAIKGNNIRIITIDAAQKTMDDKLRVAAYARVSSDSSDQLNSFAAQKHYYTKLITSNDKWTLAGIYADEGITGTSIEKRVEFMKMIDDCHRGMIDIILVKSISRFARNTKECLEVVRELKSIGVSVEFEEQRINTSNLSSELMTAMFASIAQKESESISQNMRWSYKHRFESGTFLPSSVPYGYTIVNRTLVPKEDEAEIVRQIFIDYLSGKGTAEIAKELRDRNIPCKSGESEWHTNSICYILSNEHYIGNSLWQKRYTTDTLPRKKISNKGERAQYYAEGTHQGIIDEDIYYAVQSLKKNKSPKNNKSVDMYNPLRHNMICRKCNCHLRKRIVRGKSYWACLGREKRKDNYCDVKPIPEDEIHSAFLRLYYKLKHHPDILSDLKDNLISIRERKLLLTEDIVETNKKITELLSQNHLLNQCREQGLIDPDIFISQSNELAEALRAAKLQKERILSIEGNDMIPCTEDMLESLETGPEIMEDFDAELFSELVDSITVIDETELCFRLHNGIELTEYIERTIR